MSIVLKGGSTTNVAEVTANGELNVVAQTRGWAIAASSFTFTAGQTGTAGPVDVSAAGNVTFIVKNTVAGTAFTGNPVLVFERSDDGVSWSPLLVARSDIRVAASTHVLAPGTANGSVAFDAAMQGGSQARCRVVSGTVANGMTIAVLPGGGAFTPTVGVIQPVRLGVLITAVNYAVTAATTEQMISMVQQKGTTVTNTATSFTVPAGKTFRVQSLTLGLLGNLSTATAAQTVFTFRVNTAGAATTTSLALMRLRLAVPAIIGQIDNIILTLPDGFDLPGDGVSQFGVSHNSSYVTNAPTLDVQVAGYEY